MKRSKIFLVIASSLACLSSIGCGGAKQASSEKLPSLVSPIPSSLPSPSPSPSTSPSSNPNLPPPIEMKINGVGYVDNNTLSVTVPVYKKLRVRVTPGINTDKVANTGYVPVYSKLGAFVKVGSFEQPTALLGNGLQGGQSESSTLNFAGSFTSTCGSDTSCRQMVTIYVNKPNNDFYCYNYGTYCTHTHVYTSHPWNVTLTIETDDTTTLP